jgi:hypothetical protein
VSVVHFRPQFWPKIESGEKTMTSRTRRLGRPGDEVATVWGPVIRLKSVERAMLSDVASKHFRQEGCGSPEEFADVWTEIYGSYDGTREVWLHEFEVVR